MTHALPSKNDAKLSLKESSAIVISQLQLAQKMHEAREKKISNDPLKAAEWLVDEKALAMFYHHNHVEELMCGWVGPAVIAAQASVAIVTAAVVKGLSLEANLLSLSNREGIDPSTLTVHQLMLLRSRLF